MIEDNVATLPTRLERLADKLRGYLSREVTNRQEWVEIQIGKCTTLVEMRDQFSADIDFGRWCDENGFGKGIINKDTRAYMLKMGREPETLRKCLEATERRSLEMIYRHEFGSVLSAQNTTGDRFLSAQKPTGDNSETASKPKSRHNQSRRRPAPQTETAREAIRPLVERGEPIKNRAELAERYGFSETTIQLAVVAEVARLDALREAAEAQLDPLVPEEMAPTQRQRYDAALKQARAAITAEVKAKLNEEYDFYIQAFNKRVVEADKIIASHRGLMSRKEFRMILACLHPDHCAFAQAAEAFAIFRKLEDVIVKPDAPAIAGPALPSSLAELRARRRRPI